MDHEYLPVANSVADWLHEQGHAALVEPTEQENVHTVTFRTRGTRMAIVAYESDPRFCHIRAFFKLPESAIDELAALRAAAHKQFIRKAVKVGVVWEERGVLFEIEQFLSAPGTFSDYIWRGVSIIDDASTQLFRDLRASAPSPADLFIESVSKELGLTGDGR